MALPWLVSIQSLRCLSEPQPDFPGPGGESDITCRRTPSSLRPPGPHEHRDHVLHRNEATKTIRQFGD